MIEPKIRTHFVTKAHTPTITFADAENEKTWPYIAFVGAHYEFSEPDTVKILFSNNWLVHLRGHRLQPFLEALRLHQVFFVRAQPFLESDKKNETSSFITEVYFIKLQKEQSKEE